MSMTWVTKADGTRQPFQKEKIVNTCLRMHASREAAETIADKIEKRAYNGMPTKKILQMIFKYLKNYQPAVEHQIDLKRAISLLRPQPDFERFVHLLLEEHGYVVSCNRIVRGRCVEHEVDAIARKGDETILVEIKHHFKHHTRTDLDVCRIIRATFEDLTEGFSLGLNSINFSKAMVICNTKLSNHAKQYAKCRGVEHIGWKAPPEHGLERMIEEKKLHPITFLKGLDKKSREKLMDNGIILLKQLTEHDAPELWEKTKIPRDKLEESIRKAKEILSNV